jgi:phage recombination protein Bet
MSNELTTQTNSMEMLQALRNTVAPGLTEPEFRLFAEMCRATGLNPATKEIWAIKAGGRLQLMTGINGFLKIANSHPSFDGMEVSHEWDGKNLVSCTVKVHRKDRKFPAIATAYMAEYGKPTPIWKQMPSVMLAKCAKSLAIREAFIQELGGLYTAEEMPGSFAAPRPEAPEGMETVVSSKTGEVLGYKGKDVTLDGVEGVEVIEEEGIEVAPEAAEEPNRPRKAQPTFYDVRKLTGKQLEKAVEYLESCNAKLIITGVYRAPIRLEKLTQCITEDIKDESKATA